MIYIIEYLKEFITHAALVLLLSMIVSLIIYTPIFFLQQVWGIVFSLIELRKLRLKLKTSQLELAEQRKIFQENLDSQLVDIDRQVDRINETTGE